MASSFQVLLGGAPAPSSFYDELTSLEVEENADLPGTIQLTLPVSATDSQDVTFNSETSFGPYAPIAVVVTVGDGASQCIFDGYVLSQKLHLDRGTSAASVQVWGQDASCLMNLEEKAYPWPATTDNDVANQILQKHSFTPQVDSQDASTTQSFMQRATDAGFLRDLARRNGKLFRVFCESHAGQYTGFFAKPDVGAQEVATLTLNPMDDCTVDAVDFEWDVARPTEVVARVSPFDNSDEDGVDGGATDSGLQAMDAQSLKDFAQLGKQSPVKVLLTAATGEAGELRRRSASLLREAGWFVRCEGEADPSRIGAVLRVGTVVRINGAGSLNSGRYLVWIVRHTITAESHRMKFVLLRNAMGSSSTAGGG